MLGTVQYVVDAQTLKSEPALCRVCIDIMLLALVQLRVFVTLCDIASGLTCIPERR